MRNASLWLVLLATWAGSGPAVGQSTVPIFLPGYGPSDWSLLRGSVVGSGSAETTYTIFCADQSGASCDMEDAFPFVFAEGPSTLHFEGVSPGTITADFECQMTGTTAATCTGYSSFGPGVTEGRIKGPTETSWTSTLTGSAVRWDMLTLTTPPPSPETLDLTGTMEPTIADTGTLHTSTPAAATQPNEGSRPVTEMAWRHAVVVTMLCALALA